MLSDFAPLLTLAAFVFVLGMVTWWRFYRAAKLIESTAASMDAPVRRVAGICAVAAVLLAAALILLGIEPDGAFAGAAACGFGALVALLGVLGIEGVLLEPESATVARLETGRPPPSTPLGRVVAVVLGLVPIVVVVWMLWPR